MPLIQTIQSRDVQSLTDTFSDIVTEQALDYFDTLYIDQLQNSGLVFVASDKDADGYRVYYGYVCLRWESNYTQFWRRNISEITDLFVHPTHRLQGIATQLITACEEFVRLESHKTLGISVLQSEDTEHIKQFYERLGYSEDGFGVTTSDNQVHLVKKMT